MEDAEWREVVHDELTEVVRVDDFRDGDAVEVCLHSGREVLLAVVRRGVHVGKHVEVRVQRDRLDVADLRERQRLAVKQTRKSLDRLVRRDVVFVKEDPMAVAHRRDEVALDKTERKARRRAELLAVPERAALQRGPFRSHQPDLLHSGACTDYELQEARVGSARERRVELLEEADVIVPEEGLTVDAEEVRPQRMAEEPQLDGLEPADEVCGLRLFFRL